MKTSLAIFLYLLFTSTALADVNWQPWSDDIFVRAQKEKKLVLLDLEAIWCHWCHVMDHETYSKPEIQKILNEKFIALKVDQDSRPDLANRYEDYGWPATIIFNSEGKELAKESGFIRPVDMQKLLNDLVKNPVPQKTKAATVEFPTSAELPADLKQKMVERHYKSMDEVKGGLTVSHKFLYGGTVEYSIVQATRGTERDAKFAKLTLDNNLKLIDPAWGGVYQYSTHSDWDHPHFEKIMNTQTANLRMYALAYGVWKDPKYLNAAKSIASYLKRFLTDSSGAFYTSQDADLVQGEHSGDYFLLSDSERTKQGIPKVDTHIYSRENGWAIEALAQLYAVSQDPIHLESAIRAAEWIYQNRKNSDGTFRHGEEDKAGLFLGDTLMMGKGFLSLYIVTAQRAWLTKAEECLNTIQNVFMDSKHPGAFSSKPNPQAAFEPVKNGDENINLVRFANLTSKYTGKEEYKKIAESSMRFIATPDIALDYVTNAEVLTAAEEIASEPMHLTIVAAKDDKDGEALFRAAMTVPSTYKRLEWWDKKEGPMPNPDVTYPEMPKAAAYICTNKRCSLPLFKPEDLLKKVVEFMMPRTGKSAIQ